ncbi:OLC1v1019383C1 [Oldenlandia corymbosa var. corymbosa]|uniref:OLC1v1019383C1 n=1 Tax=Oldenlandia corymbosa var. corymbosa TaxID=529605 RepID=A0AAV1EDY5_OLDCO|nr:OLC1v1019383C1 [Oldenlandia corymbosa var. corymbosa]
MATLQLIPPPSRPKHENPDPSLEESPDSLPNELIIEILTWLPAKTFLRFRVVSKSWRAMISDPKFIKAHLRNSSSRGDYAHHRVLFRGSTSASVYNYYDTRYFPLAPVLFCPAKTAIVSKRVENCVISRDSDIVGCANVIVCVGANRDELFFWNPAIRKCKKLARLTMIVECMLLRLIVLGITGLMCTVGTPTLGRRIDGFAFGVWPDPVFRVARGKLYWGNRTSKGTDIGFFDLKTETYGVVQQPDYGKDACDLDLEVLNGCLAVCCYSRTSHVDLWIMKEHGVKESWTKVLLVPNFEDPSRVKYCIPIFMSKDGKILFWYWKSLALSDPKTKSVTYPRVSFMREPWQVDVVVDSLVLVNDHDAEEPVMITDSDVIDMLPHPAPNLA